MTENVSSIIPPASIRPVRRTGVIANPFIPYTMKCGRESLYLNP
jgi:hypothetical protein